MKIKDLFTVYFFSFLIIPISYFTRMIYSRILTVDEFGLFYSCLNALVFVVIFVKLGRTYGLQYHIPELLLKKKYGQIKSLCFKFLYNKLIISLAVFMGIFILKDQIAMIYLKSAAYAWLVPIIASIIFFQILFNFVLAFLKGVNDAGLYSSLNPIRLILIFCAAVPLFFYKSQYLLLFVILIEVLSYALALIYCGIIYKRYNYIFKSKSEPAPEYIPKIKTYSNYSVINDILGTFMTSIDLVIVNIIGSLALSGIYSVVMAIASLLQFFSNPLRTYLFPNVCKLHHAKEKAKLRTMLELIYKYSAVLFIPPCFIFAIFSSDLISIFFGNKFVAGAFSLAILSLSSIFFIFTLLNFTVLDSVGLIKQKNTILILGAILNVGLDILLFSLVGLPGIPLATAIVYIVSLFWSNVYLFKVVDIMNFKPFFYALYIAALCFGPMYFIRPSLTLTWAILATIGCGIIYLGAVYFVKLINIEQIKTIIKTRSLI